ncbi:MAG: hypothetical protein FJ265_08735 [Planctomycetes bacterium]|nr:hypothetical protein [Planctomycetota bacterium]
MRALLSGASLWLAVAPLAQSPDARDRSFDPRASYQEFLDTTGGEWVARWNHATGTPSAIYGTGLPLADWRENSLEHARRHANAVLHKYRDLLGLGTSEFRESIGARMGRTWSFKFDQHFRGLPVIGGRADVRIHMTGAVSMLGSTAFPVPPDFDVTPALAEQLAVAIAWRALDQAPTGVLQPGVPRGPRLVIWGAAGAADRAPFALAWEVPVSNVDRGGRGPIGRYYVDARTGAVLHYRNDKHECGGLACAHPDHGKAHPERLGPVSPLPVPVPTTVTVMAWTRTGDDGYSPLVNVPLPGLEVNVPGVGTRTTDQNGEFTIDIAAPVSIAVGLLDGRHHAPIAGANAPSANVVVSPGNSATIQLLTAAATTNEAAHTTTSWWVDRTNTWVRSILDLTVPNTRSEMDTISGIVPTVNRASLCNAYYVGNSINFYQAGGGCANTAFSTVIAHEWGHGLDDRFGGISNDVGDGLSEGWGDILGMYLVDSPLLGSGFQTPGVALRRGDNSLLYPQTGQPVHTAGQVWMGFAWRLRERLRATYGTQQAIEISDEIVVGSVVADATNQADAVLEVFLADDDDGNIFNGVPHYAELSGAAVDKNLPYPPIFTMSLAHARLGDTGDRLAPRRVDCTAASISNGSITQVRLFYDAGAGPVVRTMHPNGGPNGYRAMLPGVPGGSVEYHIEAVHSTGATKRLPVTGEYSYLTSGPFVGFHRQDFDSGAPGWTHGRVGGTGNDDWEIGAPAGDSGTTPVPWSDPSAANSTGAVYGTDLGAGPADGRYSDGSDCYLRSPAIDCTGRFGCHLRFRRWLTVEAGLHDQATILVNGIQVWQNPPSGHVLDSVWQTVEYAIPMADNHPAVRVEFRLTSNATVNFGGWNIDDFEIGTKVATPLDAELRILPEQSVQFATVGLSVRTRGGPKPFLLAVGDTAGPTVIAGLPAVLVGGAYLILPGWTDGTGAFQVGFAGPGVASSLGRLYYSQALTFDAANTAIVTSNLCINLFTLTP